MRIDKFIFASFSLIFVLIGVIYSDFILSKKLLILFTFIGVYVGLDFRFSLKRIEIVNYQPILILVNLSIGYFLIMMAIYGAPIFAKDVELDRVILLDRGGILYRIFLAGIFAIPILMTRQGLRSNSIYLLGGIMILFMLAFRSRILDFLFMTGLALAMSRGVTRINLRGLIKLVIVTSPFLIAIFYITSIRTGISSPQELVEALIYRVFVLNTEDNISKVFIYVEEVGLNYGLSYVTDLIAVFSEDDSMAEVLTKWNKTSPTKGNTVMTPTVFSELYFNFGLMSPIFGYVLARFYSISIRLFVSKVNYLGRYYLGLRYWLTLFSLYYIPRVIVTGGFSNAIITKFLAGFLCIGIVLLITKFFRT